MSPLASELLTSVGAATVALALTLVGSKLLKRQSDPQALLVAGSLFVAISLLFTIPSLLADFTWRSRRVGIENRLAEFRAENVGCLRPGGECDPRKLASVQGLGCTARLGQKDLSWPYGCDLTPELVRLTREGGLALSVYGRNATAPDFWLVTEELLIRIQPAGSKGP